MKTQQRLGCVVSCHWSKRHHLIKCQWKTYFPVSSVCLIITGFPHDHAQEILAVLMELDPLEKPNIKSTDKNGGDWKLVQPFCWEISLFQHWILLTAWFSIFIFQKSRSRFACYRKTTKQHMTACSDCYCATPGVDAYFSGLNDEFLRREESGESYPCCLAEEKKITLN